MIQQILLECEKMIQKGSSSFYKAFAGLPSPRREAVHVIYAFCRMIDDSVDEPEKSPYSIYELRSHFENLDRAEGHFIWPALRWLFENFPKSSKELFMLQIQGQIRDLSFTHYETMDQLESYCYLVAGTVGEMLLPVLREDSNEEAQASGIALGMGMQIVNIIRDVGEDHQRGRRYLPLEIMNRNGYSQQELERGVINERFIAVIQDLKRAALDWFREGLANVHTYPPESGMAVELAAAFYAGILDDVAASGYDVFRRRAYVSDEAKLQMFLSTAARYSSNIGSMGTTAVN